MNRAAGWPAPALCALTLCADSVNGFYGAAPLRWRTDISCGADPRGVHEGGNPAARVAADREFDSFLERILR